MFCFLFQANTQHCLSRHFSLLFFIAKPDLEGMAGSFLRNGGRVNRYAVCVPFVGVCRSAGVREDRTSRSFSLVLTLSLLWYGEWKR